MAGAINNPTETFLHYLNHGGHGPDGAPAPTSPALDSAGIDPSELTDARRIEILLELFAELVESCRRADLHKGRPLADAIERFSVAFAPELTDLANAFLAETRGDYRDAESCLSTCLRKKHREPDITRPIALVERATQRMRLGLLDAALNDLQEADEYGPTLMSLHGVAIEALVHWWRGDQVQALDALEQGPRYLIQGVDFGVGWFALAAELVKNGQIFRERLGDRSDCLAREFWEARSEQVTCAYVGTLGPHMVRHELALGHDPEAILAELDTGAGSDTATGQAYAWCTALAAGDSQHLAEIADEHRDQGAILAAIVAYHDAASCADSDDQRERLLRRGRFLYDRLSRAVKASAPTDLPAAVARELTEAEQNVVSAVAGGLSNREAAEMLHCSVRTIESHLTSAYKKLGIKRRTQLAVLIAQAKANS